MKKKYRHIFFDLDRTLWDFETNSSSVLEKIYYAYDLFHYFNSPGEFIKLYHINSNILWPQYLKGILKKPELISKRLEMTLKKKNIINSDLVRTIGEEYHILSLNQNTLIPGAHEILRYLKDKQYFLYILSNGTMETQIRKLKNSDLEKYFTRLFISGTIGFSKPHKNIFHHAITSVHAKKDECLMIGDDPEVDVKGAKEYGIDQVFFDQGICNPDVSSTYKIISLQELKFIL